MAHSFSISSVTRRRSSGPSAASALNGGDERLQALRETMSELLKMDEPRRRYAAMMSDLDIRYDLGMGHPLLGRRMPDLGLVTESGPRRVFPLLHDARPVLLNLGEPGAFDIPPWADRVRLTEAQYTGVWELQVFGSSARSLLSPQENADTPGSAGYAISVGTPERPGNPQIRWLTRIGVAPASCGESYLTPRPSVLRSIA